jgi:hypothetical protein
MSEAVRMYKAFPPGRGQLRIPLSSRGAALAGLSLYATCRPTATFAHRAAWMCVTLLGPRAIVGRTGAWQPMDDDAWASLTATWRREIGAFDDFAGYARTDVSRGGLSLLLLQGGAPLAFMKLRDADFDSLERERAAANAAWHFAPRSFSVPEPLAAGRVAGWSFFAVRALPVQLHRTPVAPPIDVIAGEIESALGGLPRPAGTPSHWRPMHGDFTPWNLRQLGTGELMLLDWEEAGWGPVGSDAVLYRAAASALSHALPAPCSDGEAIQYWRERISKRDGDARDRRLDEGMLRALAEMERTS